MVRPFRQWGMSSWVFWSRPVAAPAGLGFVGGGILAPVARRRSPFGCPRLRLGRGICRRAGQSVVLALAVFLALLRSLGHGQAPCAARVAAIAPHACRREGRSR